MKSWIRMGAVVALGLAAVAGADEPLVRFGAIADPQYAPVPPAGSRHYGNSLWKLSEAVADLNERELDFVVTLGDIIDRHAESYAHILPIYQRLRHENHFVLGNHEFAVHRDYLAAVPAYLGMARRYYDFDHGGVRFLVLDGNDLSLIANPPGTPGHEASRAMHAALTDAGAVNAMTWNGGLADAQMAWLRERLATAADAGERVVALSHFPVWPEDVHNLWNDAEVRSVLAEHGNVIAWLNGHNHAGHYGADSGIHYVTIEGMVETATETAYAVIEVYEDRLVIDGVGRATDRELAVPAPNNATWSYMFFPI